LTSEKTTQAHAHIAECKPSFSAFHASGMFVKNRNAATDMTSSLAWDFPAKVVVSPTMMDASG
jgi:hypothetical protein